MRYAIVIEKAKDNYAAYVPDLPGCVTTGATIENVQRERSASTSTDCARTAFQCRKRLHCAIT